MSTINRGRSAEQQALAYLLKQGLKLLGQNYYCRSGEIDLIMQEGDYLVFIEVRSRSNIQFGDAIASITFAKRQKIIRTASHYLLKNKRYEQTPVRFDVIGIEGNTGVITWLKDAFNADY
ncbi:YraN family protein [Legionella worsleiensis]|uniref:UPF0102 protein Lwor_1203 n=1 Tax=Legionella worsleiensis TaxID=45076 RepID=A0A0W1AEE3_9GAMM|nr:YraN family protein [Legionella worsleiensis]KTD79689.1 hypothetical protein Lwor_1203 [Legionella worsleiensis]STY32200.1 putative endonuclease distantly related to archaeal Holliday junction resolvase [Legionella worsleiensis]